MLTPSLFASISICLIAKDIDFQFVDNSISCKFRYDLPIDLNLIIQSNATDMTKSCITNRLLNSIVIKLVKLNVPFVFKNKTIEFDFRENTDIATISPDRAPKLLEQVVDAIRIRHYSIRTEEAYVYWVRAFIRFHGLRHPRDMGAGGGKVFVASGN